MVIRAGVTIWGVYDYEGQPGSLTNIDIWISATTDFRKGHRCYPSYTAATTKKPFTLLCNYTLPDTRYVTLFRPASASQPSLTTNEIQPLRYGACVGATCTC